MGRSMALVTMATLAPLLGACAGEQAEEAQAPAAAEEVAGSCADAHGSQVCTWATTQEGRTHEVGATIPLASLENSPAEMQMAWPPATMSEIPMPAQGGFSHLTLYWEPMGHGPATYLTPHYDFHFYLIPDAERRAIDCSDLTKPETLPTGYALFDEKLPPEVAQAIGVETLIGACVPQMGMHSVPATDLEAAETFRGSIVVGYYQQRPIFIEPMISRALLLERQSFELPIPAIPGLAETPDTFRADYDAATDSYRFTLTGFPAAQ